MSEKIEKGFLSTKTYVHSVGLSAAFRQHRAKSHCRFIHGYALSFKLTFAAEELDENGWVQDFGGLKKIKAWLEGTFDHKLIVAEDDPQKALYEALQNAGIAQVVYLPAVGCERFAEHVFDHVIKEFPALISVECREHEGNSAICVRK
jgi:6-pyruvoyltetrahydropterin/6-carboxytetrahydropterin synthase